MENNNLRWWNGDENFGKVITPYKAPYPIFQTEFGWFFCNEVWADAYGPFESEEECEKALKEYAKSL